VLATFVVVVEVVVTSGQPQATGQKPDTVESKHSPTGTVVNGQPASSRPSEHAAVVVTVVVVVVEVVAGQPQRTGQTPASDGVVQKNALPSSSLDDGQMALSVRPSAQIVAGVVVVAIVVIVVEVAAGQPHRTGQ